MTITFHELAAALLIYATAHVLCWACWRVSLFYLAAKALSLLAFVEIFTYQWLALALRQYARELPVAVREWQGRG